jgi:molecular chaperone GrpE
LGEYSDLDARNIRTGETGAEGGEGRESVECEPVDALSDLQRLLAEKEEEAKGNYDLYLRARADLENMRKRWNREREDLAKFASLSVIRKLLPAMDDFERALGAAGKSADLESLVKGVEMTQRRLTEILSDEEVIPIPAAGLPFDPAMHEALFVEENTEYADNTVIEELQKGYTMRGRVVRPSMVKVARNQQ